MNLQFQGVGLPGRAHPRLDDVSLHLRSGELVAVVGPNGAGKSSLVRAALCLVKPTAGRVTLDGDAVSSLSARERAARIGWLPQSAPVEEGLLVREAVAAARFRFRESRHASLSAADAALLEVDAPQLAGFRVDRLSGGELQRVRLAALVAQDTKLWLLDEPGNHLDPSHQLSLCRTLVQQVDGGRGVLVVTHDLSLLPFLDHPSTRVVALREGAVQFSAALDDVHLPAQLGELYGIAVHRVQVDGASRFVLGRAP